MDVWPLEHHALMLAPALALAAGPAVWLLRHRRTDGPARCRRCGYDAAGLMPRADLARLAAGGAARALRGLAARPIAPAPRVARRVPSRVPCPECGTNLARPGRLITRRPARRPRLRALAAVALAAPALLAAGSALTSGPTSQRSAWRLLLDVRLGNRGTARQAVRELRTRWWDGRLPAAAERTLAAWSVAAWTDGVESACLGTPTPLSTVARAALRDGDLFTLAASTGSVPTAVVGEIAAAAMAALADDGIWGNADTARVVLQTLDLSAEPALRHALRTGDAQQKAEALLLLLALLPNDDDPLLAEAAVSLLAQHDIEHWSRHRGAGLYRLMRGTPRQRRLLVGALSRAVDAPRDERQARNALSILLNLANEAALAEADEPSDANAEPAGPDAHAGMDAPDAAMLRRFAAGVARFPSLAGPVAVALSNHASAAEPIVRDMLASAEPAARFVAALVLLRVGRYSDADAPALAAAVLPHLRDNTIGGDAALAVAALLKIGPAALPSLHAELDSPDLDAQARDMIPRVMQEILDPARTPAEVEARWNGNAVAETLRWDRDRLAPDRAWLDLRWPDPE